MAHFFSGYRKINFKKNVICCLTVSGKRSISIGVIGSNLKTLFFYCLRYLEALNVINSILK